jgi:hypothetical protein
VADGPLNASVERQADITLATAHGLLAFRTPEHRGEAAPVQEEDSLLTSIECLLQRNVQAPGEE